MYTWNGTLATFIAILAVAALVSCKSKEQGIQLPAEHGIQLPAAERPNEDQIIRGIKKSDTVYRLEKKDSTLY